MKWRTVLVVVLIGIMVDDVASSHITRKDSNIKPSNPLGLQIKYRVAWLDESSGLFGGNLTISLPSSALNSKWSLKFIFSDSKTRVNEYWGDWTMERYQSGWYVILPLTNPSSLADSYLFNGQFFSQPGASRDALFDIITPSTFSLAMNDSPGNVLEVPLFSPFDYINVPVDSSVRSEPFGPYLRASLPLPKPSSAVSDPSQYGEGTDIQTTPVGLYIYLIVFIIGLIVFSVGTIQRQIFRRQFREQNRFLQEQIKLIEEASKPL